MSSLSFNDRLIAMIEAEIAGGDHCHQTGLALASLQANDSVSTQAAACVDMGWDYLSLVGNYLGFPPESLEIAHGTLAIHGRSGTWGECLGQGEPPEKALDSPRDQETCAGV